MFQGKKTFIAYLTAGDGGIDYSVESFLALIRGGVDLLEIGIPFSDPVADGPVIQQAMQRALKEKITPSDVLTIVKKIRQKSSVPIVLFSYYNPVLQGGRAFLEEAKKAGVDGFLIVDLPFEESGDFRRTCKTLDLALIPLAAPSTPLERVKMLTQESSGFLYYVMRKGTTGMRNALPSDFQEKIQGLKQVSSLPVACGFGVSTREMARDVLAASDAFVVGSFFVQAVEKRIAPDALCELAKNLDPRRDL